MTDTTIIRKKNTGEPGNGGHFGSVVRSDGGIELTVDTRALAEAPIDWDSNDDFVTFSPDEIGSDLPAGFIDAWPESALAGIDIDDDPSGFDPTTDFFYFDEYDAQVDRPEDDEDKVQVKFRAFGRYGVSTRAEAVDVVKEHTKLREYLNDRKTGEYEVKLAKYRAGQVIVDAKGQRTQAHAYNNVPQSLRHARADLERGHPAAALHIVDATLAEVRRLSNSVTPVQLTHLRRLSTSGTANRQEAIAEAKRAAELFLQYSRRDEHAAVVALSTWLRAGNGER